MRRTVPLVLVGALALPPVLPAARRSSTSAASQPRPGSVEKLEIGTQSREDVVRLIGSPSTVATFNPNVWYYISQKQEILGLPQAGMPEQNVMQLSFNESGRLTTIKKYDLADARTSTWCLASPRPRARS